MAQAAPDQLSRHKHAPVVSHVPCPEQAIPSLVSPAQAIWHITPAKPHAHPRQRQRDSERRGRDSQYSQGVSVCANVFVTNQFFASSIGSGHE